MKVYIYNINSNNTLKMIHMTDIHLACVENKYNIVEQLIKNTTYLNLKNNIGETPLFVSCKKNNINIVKLLINKGCDLNESTFFKYTPLHIAAINKHYEIAKLLIFHGAIMDKQNTYNGNTSLHEACTNGCIDIIKLFLKKQELIFIKNKNNITPLFLINDDNILESLIISKETDYIIHVLCKNKKKDLLLLAFKNNLNINCKDENGNTALHNLSDNINYEEDLNNSNNIDLINLLIENGADTNIQNKKGETLLHKACQYGILEIVKLLIGKTNINLANNEGMTSLHIACKYDKIETVKLLLETIKENTIDLKINLLLKNKDGFIALYYACLNNNFDMINLLLENSKSINLTDIIKIKKNITNLDIIYILDKYFYPSIKYDVFVNLNPFYMKHLEYIKNIKSIKTIKLTFPIK